jgi:hypothetical protein
MFQLSLTLLFDPTEFKNLESYNSWNSHFKDLEEWIQDIKITKGYQLAKLQTSKTYKLTFCKI